MQVIAFYKYITLTDISLATCQEKKGEWIYL